MRRREFLSLAGGAPLAGQMASVLVHEPGFARRRASAVSGVNAGIQANRNCVGKLVNDRMASAARVTPATRWKGSG
jgi:hypothetical protein